MLPKLLSDYIVCISLAKILFMRYYLILFIAIVFVGCAEQSEHKEPKNQLAKVQWIGAMKHVMHTGDLSGKIWLDSVNKKEHLYGLGPTEGLGKEIMVVDGHAYVSAVATDTSVTVVENSDVKAPFFVYAYPESWKEMELPDSVISIEDIELFLDDNNTAVQEPFMFRLTAVVDSATIHIVNLHDGAVVNSPADAHEDQKQFPVQGEEVDIIGFFSRTHQKVFIHHDALTHMHLITKDRQKMGHLDELHLKKGTAKLYLGLQ